jgi:HlyD family secretion protein
MPTPRQLAVAVATLIIMTACGPQGPAAPEYETAAVERRPISVVVEAAGVIEPVSAVEVKSKASGEILEIGADIGDTVEQGFLLVRVDRRTPRNRMAQSEAELNAARARRTTAQAQLERGQSLLAEKWINQADFEGLVLDVANARAAVISAEVAVENARIALEDTEVRAPAAGTILTKPVERGQVISSPTMDVGGGTLLLTMADLSMVRARVRVDETDIGKLSQGIPARITVAAYPGRTFSGTIEKIEPQAVVEQNVTLFSVLISIANEERLLRPGMNVETVFDVAHRESALTLPVMALRTQRDLETTAGILGVAPEELQARLDGPAPKASSAATVAPQTIQLGDRTVTLPPGVDAARVQAIMRKRRDGGELNAQERGLMQQVFRPAGSGMGGARSSALEIGRNLWVVAVKDGQYEPTRVQTGVTDLDRVEITEGLAEGDVVLLLPSASLVETQQQIQNFASRRGGIPGITQRQGNNTQATPPPAGR